MIAKVLFLDATNNYITTYGTNKSITKKGLSILLILPTTSFLSSGMATTDLMPVSKSKTAINSSVRPLGGTGARSTMSKGGYCEDPNVAKSPALIAQ